MQSIANTSNISIYVHFHATEKLTSRRVFWDVFCTNFKTIYQITSIYIIIMYIYHALINALTIWLVTITQSRLGTYLYSADTQHRNLLKLLVMTSMVICHQKIKGHINTIILKKTHLFQSFSNNLYKTHLISSNNKRDMRSKMTPPFFF